MSEASPVGSVGSASEAVDELQGLTLEEQERQRAEWSQVNYGLYFPNLKKICIYICNFF